MAHRDDLLEATVEVVGPRELAGVRRSRGWREALSPVEIEGGTASQRRIFYTALYHTMIAPNLYQDVDGRFRGLDLEIHENEGYTHYTVFSLWDTFRAIHPRSWPATRPTR